MCRCLHQILAAFPSRTGVRLLDGPGRREAALRHFARSATRLFAEYLGLDYSVALKLHLDHYVFRDLVRWAMTNGYKWFQSSGLNYDLRTAGTIKRVR